MTGRAAGMKRVRTAAEALRPGEVRIISPGTPLPDAPPGHYWRTFRTHLSGMPFAEDQTLTMAQLTKTQSVLSMAPFPGKKPEPESSYNVVRDVPTPGCMAIW